MKKDNLFLAIVFLLFSVSCVSQTREMRKKSNVKLEGHNTSIRELIDIDGYYSRMKTSNLNGQERTYAFNQMFFEDGTYACNFTFKEGIKDTDIHANMSESVESWTRRGEKAWNPHWGVYKIEGDTIIIRVYEKGAILSVGFFEEDRYKIIDRKTVKKIYYKSLFDIDKNYTDPWITDAEPSHFIPADSLLSTDCWLKEEKWIWRNETDWKAYKEMIKQKKKEQAK